MQDRNHPSTRYPITLGLTSLLNAWAIALFPSSALAQPTPEPSACAVNAIAAGADTIVALGRAKHLARQAAESANGGLEVYHADASMHGPVSLAPCVDNGSGSWTFTVRGGAPGFTTPTQDTVVTVDRNGWIVKVDYNGPVR
jgi:hypothetical protein